MSLINSNIGTSDELYVPDFSYAGYHNGLKEIPTHNGTIVHASKYNVLSNDGLDDTCLLYTSPSPRDRG